MSETMQENLSPGAVLQQLVKLTVRVTAQNQDMAKLHQRMGIVVERMDALVGRMDALEYVVGEMQAKLTKLPEEGP